MQLSTMGVTLRSNREGGTWTASWTTKEHESGWLTEEFTALPLTGAGTSTHPQVGYGREHLDSLPVYP